MRSKKISKHPENFGRGAIEESPRGAPTTRRAVAAGSRCSVGPADGLGHGFDLWRLLIHGLAPGPLFIKNSPEVFWGVLGSMVIGNVLLIILNLPLIGLWIKVLQVPYFLFPLIILFSIIGAYVRRRPVPATS